MQPTASIIIVNWNGLAHLPDCLGSLAAQTFQDFEVILVDNGSSDASLTFVRERYPRVKLVPLPENIGFAAGNNHGLGHAVGRHIVTLNNDTRVDVNWLEILVRVADAHPDAGMIGCRICAFSDNDLIDSIGMAICADAMSRGHYRNRRWSNVSLAEVEETLFPSACAALYKREMIEQIGFFDEDFFAYAEDSDLGLRGRLAGWGAVLATRAVVYHKYSQTGGRLSSFKVYLVERNHYWVAVKNFPLLALATLPFHTLHRYFEQIRLVLLDNGTGAEFRGGGEHGKIVKALVKATWDSLTGLPRMLQKRRQVMALRRLSMLDFARLLHRYRITFKELLDNGNN